MNTIDNELLTCIQGAASFEDACRFAVSWLRERVEYFNWVGIYTVQGEHLTLAAWDGPAATEHVRIPIGMGICGLAAQTGDTVIVDDVNADSRYLACFPHTRSEIVVPISHDGRVVGEIDIDSDKKAAFSVADKTMLEQIATLLGQKATSIPE